ncbi:hypothetical protein H7F51_05100 [Novosphingobium flavum]|uniref:Lipoprotein n=1 Tax=Novosphingobium flavum TaxID=1778672 RepID=A0A7X1KKW0_9SPHN|nr:hypothetical protein [Novosphingobium flavum]MBC2664887.1 hypothetical protein [Novosphingobium flavum]
MRSSRTALSFLAATGLAVTLAGCSKAGNPEAPAPTPTADAAAAAADASDPIKSAMSAAPASVGAKAAVVMANADGSMKTLREGTNGFTCMPDNPATPGHDPMCMDGNAMEWAMAWMGHKTPPAEKPGFMYMLEGGTDASNTDPYSTKPDKDWIKTGPHVMVVGSKALLAGYPSGPNPDTSAPYVMWAGTPYEHLMVPVS